MSVPYMFNIAGFLWWLIYTKISFWNHIRMRSLQKSCSSETETNKFTEKKITKGHIPIPVVPHQGGGGSCKNKTPIGQVDCCRTMDRKVVGVSGYLSVYLLLSVFLSVHLSIYLSCLPIYLSIYMSIYLSICISICLSVYLSLCLSVTTYMSLCLSVYLYLSACLSFYLAVRLTTYLSV